MMRKVMTMKLFRTIRNYIESRIKLHQEFLHYLEQKSMREAAANGDQAFFVNSYTDVAFWKKVMDRFYEDGVVEIRALDGTVSKIYSKSDTKRTRPSW